MIALYNRFYSLAEPQSRMEIKEIFNIQHRIINNQGADPRVYQKLDHKYHKVPI